MKYFLSFCILIPFVNAMASSSIDYTNIISFDGTPVQVCAKYPDPNKFSGKRPAVMIVPGSGRYDTCVALEREYSNKLVEKGIVVFVRQKRGLSRNLLTGKLKINSHLYLESDFNNLKLDTLAAFEYFQNDKRVDSKNISLYGASGGTVQVTHVAMRHPEVKEVNLISSLIENFYPNVVERQFYNMLPADLIKALDKRMMDGQLSNEEMNNEMLASFGLQNFKEVDIDKNSFIDLSELSDELRRVINWSIENSDSTFFLSDIGPKVPISWFVSAIALKPLGPQVLLLQMPVYFYHGLEDTNTLVQPVKKLEQKSESLSKTNIKFTYYPNLAHSLSKNVLLKVFQQIGNRLVK